MRGDYLVGKFLNLKKRAETVIVTNYSRVSWYFSDSKVSGAVWDIFPPMDHKDLSSDHNTAVMLMRDCRSADALKWLCSRHLGSLRH